MSNMLLENNTNLSILLDKINNLPNKDGSNTTPYCTLTLDIPSSLECDELHFIDVNGKWTTRLSPSGIITIYPQVNSLIYIHFEDNSVKGISYPNTGVVNYEQCGYDNFLLLVYSHGAGQAISISFYD